MCASATSTQSNEDTQVLQRDHRLLLLVQHDRSVHDIENLYSPHNSDSSSDKIDTKYTTKIIKINLIRT